VESTKVEIRKISGSWVGKVCSKGEMLYIVIPARTAEYFDIQVGDYLNVDVKEVRRETFAG